MIFEEGLILLQAPINRLEGLRRYLTKDETVASFLKKKILLSNFLQQRNFRLFGVVKSKTYDFFQLNW